ncbi:MAG: DUF2125 domain-containing protein [Defluviicoccus sp.]|nr:DUF2125 domain-containing protein [Defluviicoccus sp.]MDE0383762.1 DUF2125 domain-containing protein [Defluviicoccus sp.]
MARKAAFGAAALCLLAALVYSAAWWVAADRLRHGFDGWAAEMRARGWTVSYERMRVEGYPGPLVPILEAPAAAAPGWRWEGPTIAARAWPWNPSRIAFAAQGEHRIWIGAADAAPVRTRFGAATGLLRRPRAATGVDLALGDIEIRMPGRKPPRSIAGAEASIVLPDRSGRADPGRGPEPPGPTIALTVAGIEIAGTERRIDSLSLEAKLTGPVPRVATPRGLARWRDGGGVVEIGNAALRSRRARIAGSGTIALDRDLQPIAAFSFRIDGSEDLLRLLVALDAVEKKNAGAIGLGLQLLAKADKGKDDSAALPVTIQNRRLYLGPLSVMRLPRIDWGR